MRLPGGEILGERREDISLEISGKDCKKDQRWQISFSRNKYVQCLGTRQAVYLSGGKRDGKRLG